jgi:glutamate/tyrosine decarboxylase-like PLP-dependent enzyme
MSHLLHAIADSAVEFLESLPRRPVGAVAGREELLRALGGPLPGGPRPDELVIRELVAGVGPGLVASAGPRYFGFVIGGATPAALAADWLTSTWDQNAQVYATSPAAAVVEEIVAGWLLELLGLPPGSSVGFVTGGQAANLTALAVGRQAVLRRAGWDFEENGLAGAPEVAVFLSEEAHATVRNALRMLGLGARSLHHLPADDQGRMRLDWLAAELRRHPGPAMVSVQAGNVNTGTFEPVGEIAELCRERGAWVHVDGAFGLWAAASPRLRTRLAGLDRADSWTGDAHKWLNVPLDSGMVVVRDPGEHQRLKGERCAYAGAAGLRDGSTWVPENSRRARAFVLYAALRSLGVEGVRRLVEGCCDRAAELAAGVSRLPHARVLNDVVLNQVLVRFQPPHVADMVRFHDDLALAVQRGGRCWIGSSRWKGQPTLRLSVSNWSTTTSDVQDTLAALGRALEEVLRGCSS